MSEREDAQKRVAEAQSKEGTQIWDPREWNQHLYDVAVAEGRRPNVKTHEVGDGMVITRHPPELEEIAEPNPNAPEREQEVAKNAKVNALKRKPSLLDAGGGIESIKKD